MENRKKNEIEKKAVVEGRKLIYADESAFQLCSQIGNTWSKIGQTPIIPTTCKYKHLSVAGAICEDGSFFTKISKTSFTGSTMVEFLQELQEYIGCKLLIVWDGAAIHRCKEVKEFLLKNNNQIHLERQPAYSPELNPIELVWGLLKKSYLSNYAAKNLTELEEKLKKAIEAIKENPDAIKGFFKHVNNLCMTF